jgi:hypothetical protein
MWNTMIGGVHIVAASKGGKVEYWAAATSRENAATLVQKLVPSGWKAVLTDRRITPEHARALKLLPDGAEKLKYVP